MTEHIRYGEFVIDPAALDVRRGGERLRLAPQAVRVLLILVQRTGELVTREELYRELWPGETDVDVDRALNTLVRQIRRAMGDSATRPVYLHTYPGRGYRLAVPQVPQQSGKHPPRAWRILVAAAAVVLAVGGAMLTPRRGGEHAIPATAREDFLLGRHLLEQPDAGKRSEAVTHFQRAVAGAPSYAPAHAFLAGALLFSGRTDDARAALATAFALDSAVPRAWMVASFLALVQDWDWRRAELMLVRAISLDPRDAELHAALGFVLATAGRRDDAAETLAAARALDPVSAIVVGDIGQIYRYIGREADAADACARAAALAWPAPFALDCVFEARLALGDTRGAREAVARMLIAGDIDTATVFGTTPVTDADAVANFRAWRAERAAGAEQTDSYPAFAAALALSMADRRAEALDALARDATRRGLGFVTATVEPAFAPLRRDPAFHRLVAPLVHGGAAPPGSG